MIDTDKYEAHTPAPWTIDIHKVGEDTSAIVIESNMTTHSNCVLAEVEVENKYAEADAQLIADAPLLLAEVKRLREELDGREAYIKRLSEQLVRATKWAYKQVLHNDSAMMDFDDYVWGEEE